MRQTITFLLVICCTYGSSLWAQPDYTAFGCGDTLSAAYFPLPGVQSTDTFFIQMSDCVPRIRIDFTTSDVPDGAELLYLDGAGTLTPAGSLPYFGGNCSDTANYFSDPTLGIESSLDPGNCLPGFVEMYGRGIPYQDSMVQRTELPADFKLAGSTRASARLHLDIPEGTVGLLLVVRFNPNEATIFNASWDCTPPCCVEAEASTPCAGEDLQLRALQEVPTYRWRGPLGFQSNERNPVLRAVRPEQAGWYVLLATNAVNCVSTDSVYVEVRTAEVSLEADTFRICEGANAELLASGASTYEWDLTAPGIVSTQGGRITVSPPAPTTYQVVGIGPAGCRDTAASVVIPQSLSVRLQGEAPTCTGRSDGRLVAELLSGQLPLEIRPEGGSWQAGPALENLAAGSYQVEVRDAAGCTTEVNALLEAPDPVSVDVGTQRPSCLRTCDGALLFLAQGGEAPYRYFVDGQEVDVEPDGLCAKTFAVEVKDSRGCVWTSTATIEEAEAFTLNLGGDRQVAAGSSIALNANASATVDSLVWEGFCEQGCEEQLDLQVDTSLQVRAVAWSESGCVAADTVNIEVQYRASCNDGIYAPTAFSPNQDGINDAFTLYADPDQRDVQAIDALMVFNKWGRKVFEQRRFTPGSLEQGWDGTFGGAPLPPEAYVWVGVFETEQGLRYQCSGSVILLR